MIDVDDVVDMDEDIEHVNGGCVIQASSGREERDSYCKNIHVQ